MWPDSLPQTFQSQSYGSEILPTYIETEMDFGPKKRRARFSGVLEKINGTMILSREQVATLRTFYKTSTCNGVLPFAFVHPETLETVSVRFNGAPSMSHLGGNHFSASISFEVQP